MNYSSFVKNYYKIMLNKLNDFNNYFGTIVSTNTSFIPKRDMIIPKETNLNILPGYEFIISVPDTIIEEFLEYYGTLYPDCSVFCDKNKLREFYSLMLKVEEDKQIDYIELIIDVMLQDLVDRKVLA